MPSSNQQPPAPKLLYPRLGPHRADGGPATAISVAAAPPRHPSAQQRPARTIPSRPASPRPSSSHVAARPQPRHHIHAPECHHTLRLHHSRPAAMDEPRQKQRSPYRGEYHPAATFPRARGLHRCPLRQRRCGGGWEEALGRRLGFPRGRQRRAAAGVGGSKVTCFEIVVLLT
jgi:hypothetical protein